MNKTKITTICNIVCAVLLLATLIMQFLPFWTCDACKSHKGEEVEISLSDYLWFPNEHDKFADEMTDLYKDTYGKNYRGPDGRKFKFQANEILPTALPAFLGSVFGIILCVVLRKKFFVAALPLYVGISGIIGYTSCLALTVGMNVTLHLVAAIAVAAVGGLTFVLGGILALRGKLSKIKK